MGLRLYHGVGDRIKVNSPYGEINLKIESITGRRHEAVVDLEVIVGENKRNLRIRERGPVKKIAGDFSLGVSDSRIWSPHPGKVGLHYRAPQTYIVEY